MVTQNPSSSTTPTKPKKVWTPKPAAEGVPSMFAHATLSKPLKVNAATTSTVRQRTSKATPTTNIVPGAAAKTTARKDKDTKVAPTTVPATPKFAETMPSTATPVVTAAPKAPSTTSIQEAAARSSAPKAVAAAAATKSSPSSSSPDGKFRYSHTKPKRNSSADNSAKLVIGGCTTVAGIPKSWPKPHAVPPDAKPKIAAKPPPQPKTKPKPKNEETNEETTTFHKDIDQLIPEMYRRKSAAELEREQQEEIQTMRRIMWELRRQEIEKEEKALQCKPIGNEIEATLRALKNAKKQNDMADDHSSFDDSDATPKQKSAYSTHVRSKLAFFNSTHSKNLSLAASDSDDDDDSNDSSSVSSWDSDASDGLFRG